MSGRKIDVQEIIGKRFNRLIVLGCLGKIFSTYKLSCVCDCGNICIVRYNDIRAGYTKSCGCIKAESNKSRSRLPGLASAHGLYSVYKRGALKRGYEFLIDEDVFRDITSSNCYWCGIEPRGVYLSSKTTTPYIYNGIDRVDNTKGYTFDNCVPCCKICNLAKSTLSAKEFIEWGTRLGNHLRKIGEVV